MEAGAHHWFNEQHNKLTNLHNKTALGTLIVKRWHEIHASACTLAILVEQMEQCRLGGHGDYCSAEKEEKVDRTAHDTLN